MTDNGGTLRGVSWRDLCPWLIIFRTFSVAISPPVLFLALLGALMTPVGWLVSSQVFARGDKQLEVFVTRYTHCPCLPESAPVYRSPEVKGEAGNVLSLPGAGLARKWYFDYVEPFVMLFRADQSLSRFAFFLFGGLWTLVIWAYFGGAITRIAAMHLGREERVSLADGMTLAYRKYGAYLAAPLLPLLGVVGVGLPVAALGLLMIADWGILIGGLGWFLALVSGFIMALMLLGLLFGWPLMWVTISAEGSDAFDGLSRSYAYTFQRPLHYLFYAAVATVFGVVCYTLVFLFSESLIQLTFWAASWGTNVYDIVRGDEARIAAGVTRLDDVMRVVNEGHAWSVTGVGGFLIYALNAVVRGVAWAFTFGFFWCAMTAIYLLLRHDVDQTELDEIWTDEKEAPFGQQEEAPTAAGQPPANVGAASTPASESEPKSQGGEDQGRSDG